MVEGSSGSFIVFAYCGLADGDRRSTVAGGKVSQFAPDSVGLNPVWRDALFEMTCGASWDEETPLTEIQALLADLRQNIQAVHDATPNDGAYLNEVRYCAMSSG